MTDIQTKYTEHFLTQRGIPCKKDFPLWKCSTFRIGGNADFAVIPSDTMQLHDIIMHCRENDIRFDVFGRCSNVLFDDEGYRGIVILTTDLEKMEVNGNYVTAQCGVSLTALAHFAANNDLCGMEFLCGIPGSVGGAVFMNGGAYGGEISQILYDSTAIDLNSGEFVTIKREDHCFGYRKSIYQSGNYMLASAVFELQNGSSEQSESLMRDYMQRRIDKQPLEMPSAGSVFKRPEGYFAGALIEGADLKGKSVGGAMVSPKHAGFIVNTGDATSSDVKQLIMFIQKTVLDKYGVELECEVRMIPKE